MTLAGRKAANAADDGSPRAGPRKPIGAKLRFEVLKRDGFTCVYCGAKPPTPMHVDHVKPVAEGGTDDPGNLVTACAKCNGGKGATPLSKSAKAHTAAEALRRAKEAAEVEDAYAAFLAERRELAVKRGRALVALYNEEAMQDGFTLTPVAEQSVFEFAEKLPDAMIEKAMYAAIRKVRWPLVMPQWTRTGRKYREAIVAIDQRFRYFCGVCHNMIREQGGGRK